MEQSEDAQPEHAVLVYIKLSDARFGTSSEFEAHLGLEEVLDKALAQHGAGELDGDEVGEGYCTIYMYGPSADEIARIVHPLIRSFSPPAGSYLVKRYGEPGAREEQVDLQPRR